PWVIMIDMDPAMDAACQKARNSLSIEVFERRFQSLLERYPNGNKYLSDTIYSTRQSWAKSFINRIFTAGMQSTSHVKSINSIIHKAVSSSSSILDPFVGTSSQQYQDDNNVPKFIPRHYYNVQEVQVRNCIQKKLDYGRLMGHFKKALSYSLEDNDQITSDYMKLSDGHVYNYKDIKDPVVCKGKALNEETNKASSNTQQTSYDNVESDGETRRRCGICHKSGYYAPSPDIEQCDLP
ncbi:13093_t:CDS:2, partial [Racocetra fulgida]